MGVRRPLIVTADPDLLEELLRLSAGVGSEVDAAADAAGAARCWSGAPLVILGADQAAGVVAAGLPRRDGVVLVGDDLDDAGIWQRAVAIGAAHVVFLPDAEAWLCAELAAAADGQLPLAPVVAVVGGRGGAGATTFACALAVTGVRAGRAVLLVDGDPLGGGIDLVFGAENDRGLRWPDLARVQGRLPGGALSAALPRIQDLRVLSWDRAEALAVPAAAMEAVLRSERRSCDVVVVDLPRVVDDCSRVVLAAAALVVIVVPAEVRAAASASRVAASVGQLCRDVRVVVRGPAPGRLCAADVAESLRLPLLGELAPEPGIRQALERGDPPARRGRGPLSQLCRRVLDEVVPPPGADGSGRLAA